MATKNALIKMLQTHKAAEANMVNICAKLEKEVHSAAAKLLLAEMRLDSQKHENILKEILLMLEGIPKPDRLWDARIQSYVDVQVMKRELEKHIKLEDDMLADVEREIRQSDDEAVKTLLTHIAEDEKKHHKNMELIIKKSYAFTP
jgi:bacterioferritin (cytochrome b1)